MNLIIAGSRRFPSLGITKPSDWGDWNKVEPIYNILLDLIDKNISIESVTNEVSGKCWGIDELGEYWAMEYNKPVLSFPANWDKYKKAAGPIRNSEMEKVGHVLVAICTPKSRGTLDMIHKMEKADKPVIKRFIN